MASFELPTEQPAEKIPTEHEPEISVINGALDSIKEEERKEKKRKREIDEIEEEPTIH